MKNGLDTAKNEPQVVASGVCPDLTPLCKRRDVFKSTPTFKSSKWLNRSNRSIRSDIQSVLEFVVAMKSDALIQLQHFFKIFLCCSLDLFSCIIVSHITTIVNPTKCERLIFLLRFTFERLCSRHSWRWVGRRRARELYQTSLFDYRPLFGLWILTRRIVNGVLR